LKWEKLQLMSEIPALKKNKLREDNFAAVAAADEEGCRQTV
jgi:hypothetical protein